MNKKNCSVFLVVLILASACSMSISSEEKTKDSKQLLFSQKQQFTIDTLTNQLKNPWGMVFLPEERILITEKSGTIRIVDKGKLLNEEIQGIPEVYFEGQGGLLDIQLHPNYPDSNWIYFSFAKPVEKGGATTVARAHIEGTSFTNVEEIFQAQPAVNSGLHFGSRMAFDNAGHIFITCGERGTKENAQTLENHLGKVIRLYYDGRLPEDNPFINTPDAKPEIWSYGHRNLQGLYYDKITETLWEHEHGPKGGDELNIILKGKNYGWPEITYGIDYDGSIISEYSAKAGMEQPVTFWRPSIAPCGMTMVTSDRYPNWKNNLLIGALALTHVARVEINEKGNYIMQEKLLEKIGRVRALAQGPDGYIYIATESPGMLLKIIPELVTNKLR